MDEIVRTLSIAELLITILGSDSRSLPLEWVHIKVPDRSLEQLRLTSDPITEGKDGVSVTINAVADVISVVYGGLVMSGVERVIVVVDISEVYIVVYGVVVSAKMNVFKCNDSILLNVRSYKAL